MVSTFFFTRLAFRDGRHFRSRGSAAGRMSETAEERKKRLRAMRDEAEKTEPELKFRNYLPRDEALQEGQVRARERALEMRLLPKAAAVDLATLATSPDEPIPKPTAQIKARQAPDFEAPVVEKEPEEEDEVRPSSQTTFARAETPLAAFTRRHLTLDVPPLAQTAVLNVMPKKANFDLKRDVEKKMERLERKTQRAMIELMREEEERRVAEAQDGK